MAYHLDDTIAAIATAAGEAARGMVRVSGGGALGVADACFAAASGQSTARLCRAVAIEGSINVRLGERDAQVVPADLFVWPTSRSYTREPVVEFHTFGSPSILDALLTAVCRAGARLAEPGEFTLRAFLAGRLDLTQAEAVLGVIDARGGEELTTALAQLAGGLARPLDRLRTDLLQLLAELEAGLDFVDEDIEFITQDELLHRLSAAAALLSEVELQMASRLTVACANQVVLVGEPNAGKSSLFNAIVARHRARSDSPGPQQAIVSPAPGTTRDYLTAQIELGGVRCELIDTAGVDRLIPAAGVGTLGANHSADFVSSTMSMESAINEAAQSHSRAQLQRATMRVWCVDSSTADTVGTLSIDNQRSVIIVATKADLPESAADVVRRRYSDQAPVVATSAVTGMGLDELCRLLCDRLTSDATAAAGRVVAATADRCTESIRRTAAAVTRAAHVVDSAGGEEIVAVEVRSALDELGKVVGAVYTDDVLDRIFKSFCIGK